ncbi:MAG: hypothetical protein NC250_01080 [Alistipes senegalensis]|nr:hypothetical protein [Bacteroides cellulosilyticus]MCM1351313.1 hypothetical protein [Alistipes senegalensis]
MKNNQSLTGSVPVTIQLPAEIAERIQKHNYDFGPLLELFGDVLYSPKEIAETLLSHYFEFSQLVALKPDDFGCSSSELNSRLCLLENLYHAIRAIEPTTADMSAEPVPVLSDN